MLDPVLARFRKGLEEAYGDRVSRVVLFGSRARGDARPDSDYDVAVFLNEMNDRWEDIDRISDIAFGVMEETDAFIHAMPYRASAYQELSPLMSEIRREGRDL